MEVNVLWENYRENRDSEIRNQLLVEYAPLVRRVVRMLPFTFMGYADENDMIGEGIFGLIDAIEKFDARRNVKFETYASLRIRGAIIDKLRKMDLLSRNTRDRIRLLEDVADRLEKRLQRPPTDQELADAVGLPEKVVRKTQEQAALCNMVSLEEMITNGAYMEDEGREGAPEEAFQRKEIRRILAEAVTELRDNEQKVVSLYYYEELTLREIGTAMGVSESRVSQILSKALSKLRKKLAAQD